MNDDKKPDPQMATWWSDYEQHNYWDSDSWDCHRPEEPLVNTDHLELKMRHEAWSIKALLPYALRNTLKHKLPPSEYAIDNLATVSCVFEDDAEGYQWDSNDKPSNIGFTVEASYYGNPSDRREARIYTTLYRRAEEVCNWLSTDPVVKGERISAHRAIARNKREVAREAREFDQLARRVKDPAHTRSEAQALLEELKSLATQRCTIDADGFASTAVFYRDGLDDQECHSERGLTCVVRKVNGDAFRAKFYWGKNSNGKPTGRKVIFTALQELFSASEHRAYINRSSR